MSSRRILITGLSTYWGGRLARELERDRAVETVIGVGPDDPVCELERTEFVRIGTQHALLRRIVQAAAIDTVIDTRMIVDSAGADPRAMHENNIVGTMNILAACSGPDTTVRKVVFKSSAHRYGAARDDPAFFTEDMERTHPPHTRLEQEIVDAEAAVAAYAERHPRVVVTTLRFPNALGPSLATSHRTLFSLPAIPCILGFDPRYQFIHEDDVTATLAFAVGHDIPGVYNAAADGVLVLSEVASLLGRPLAPILPPWGTAPAAAVLRRAGVPISPEMLDQLRYGRGLDNRRLKAAGHRFRYTSRETVLELARWLRIAPLLEAGGVDYRYEKEVEDFLRYSPSVARHEERGPVNLPPAA